jgi:YfiH family protein
MAGIAAAHPDWLRPPQPLAEGIGALMTTRAGGVSRAPYASMNLGAFVGDDPQAVQANMARLAQAIGARPVFLKQVHGARVVRLEDVAADGALLEADASIAVTPGLACTVTVADCLPVLLAAPGRRGVAAAHAGWRGLAGGVVDASVQTLCEAAACAPAELTAWLGACIGPQAFEVGADVLQAFGADPGDAADSRFSPAPPHADGLPRWWADLPGLARERLARLGVRRVSGGEWCTVSDPSRFFSYRRDRVTGRMAAAIWVEG